MIREHTTDKCPTNRDAENTQQITCPTNEEIREHTTDKCPTNAEMIGEHTTDKCPTNAEMTRTHNR